VKKSILIIASVVVLAGCATSKKVQVVQAGDQNLSCEQIKSELTRLEDAQDNVDEKKGVTGTNVAAALFWVPGLAYTYYDAGQATEAISERTSHLTKIYNEKQCN